MSRKRTKPFDLPTLLLAVAPILILALLTTGWLRSGLARKTFMDAASKGDVQELKRLLDNGANINDQDSGGWTALGYAANARQYEAVKLLLDRGANVNAIGQNYLRTPLAMACSPPFNGLASETNVRIIRLLLDHGADPRLDDNDWSPPVVVLAQNGQGESARLLIEHGADVNAKINGTSALYFAVQNGKEALVRLLLAKGADPNAQEPNTGDTALIRAAENNSVEQVKLLLIHGARTDKRDKLGQSALQWANKGKNRKIIALLIGAGAKP